MKRDCCKNAGVNRLTSKARRLLRTVATGLELAARLPSVAFTEDSQMYRVKGKERCECQRIGSWSQLKRQ